MITNNWKWIGTIASFVCWTLSVWFTALNYQSTKDDVKTKTIQNAQLSNDKIQMQKQIDYQKYAIDLSESTNQKLIDERNTILAEYDYANQNIIKYKNIINSRSHIDNSFVLFLKQSEATANAISKIATVAVGDNNTGSCAADRILLYINAIRQHSDAGYAQLNACVDFYNKIRNKQL